MMMMKKNEEEKKIRPTIKIETTHDPDYKHYHVTTEISQHPINRFYRPLRPQSDKYLEEVGEIGTQLLKEVFAISGVDQVFIGPYEFSVVKASAFDWKDVEPKVVEALKRTFKEKPEKIKILR